MNVFLDIETIPSQRPEVRELIAAKVKHPGNITKPESIEKWNEEKRPQAIEEAWRKTALNGTWGESCCICWAVDYGPVKSSMRSTVADNERQLLTRFFDDIRDAQLDNSMRPPHWVGHNIAGFYLRFIWQRAIILGVEPGIKLRQDAKPWSDTIYDTMYQWGGKDFVKLTELCTALNVDVGHEDAIDGSQVWDCYERGDFDTILTHCKADVERVREIHKRMTFTA